MDSFPIAAERVVPVKKTDTGLLIAIALLWGLGMATLYSSSGSYGERAFNDTLYFVKRQFISSCAAFVAMLFFSFINLDLIRKYVRVIVIFALVMCAFTLLPFIGVEKNGARRWIGFGGLSFQPSESVKVIVILYLAHLLAKKQDRLNDFTSVLLPGTLMLFLFVSLIFLQDDFSTSVFVLLLGLLLFFVSGVKLSWFLSLILFILPIAFLFIFSEPYRAVRMMSHFNKMDDPYGASYQLFAAQRAITSGGFWGRFGGGVKRVTSIPEVQADFIFAGWAEEMGFLGVCLYFVLLAYFAWRGIKIIKECRCSFRALIAAGATGAIFFQSLMNCGVVSGFFPATGIPLPFFSSGGSSLLVTFCFCGLLINVSRNNSAAEREEQINER